MADVIKLGNLDISAFKVGGNDCSIYLGTTKLYPQSSPTPILPSGYTQVEYVENTGFQGLDLGVTANQTQG